MDSLEMVESAAAYLNHLCLGIPGREVGRPGNRAATTYFADIVASCGFQVEQPTFDCVDWSDDGAELMADGVQFAVQVSPYSTPAQATGCLQVIESVEELEAADISGQIVLLRGKIASEPLMPKHFPFYNPDEHQRIIAALEHKAPQAIISATGQHPEMAGALYSFPMFEDGDFAIPSVYMPDVDGTRLAQFNGREVQLTIRAQRRASTGCNVIAWRGDPGERRIVLFAHIDAKAGTPGAIDNASGVVTLLLLAGLLRTYAGKKRIELVAMNGEDYYSNPGEQQYLAANAGRFDDILLGINLDGLGYRHGRTAYSLYGCPEQLAALVRQILSNHEDMVEGEQWYQGDHSLFLMNERPALAFTSERVMELMTQVVHTTADLPDRVEPARLVSAAQALRTLIDHLS